MSSGVCCPRLTDLSWDPEFECTNINCPFQAGLFKIRGVMSGRVSHSTSNLEEVSKMPKSLLTLVGMHFKKQGLKILALMEQNHPVLLVREPTNAYDPNAIAVYVPIGYIKKEEAAMWAQQLDTLNPVGTVPGRSVQNGTSNNIEIDA